MDRGFLERPIGGGRPLLILVALVEPRQADSDAAFSCRSWARFSPRSSTPAATVSALRPASDSAAVRYRAWDAGAVVPTLGPVELSASLGVR